MAVASTVVAPFNLQLRSEFCCSVVAKVEVEAVLDTFVGGIDVFRDDQYRFMCCCRFALFQQP